MSAKNIITAAALATAVLCYSPASFADKGGNGHGHGHDQSDDDRDHGERGRGDHDNRRVYVHNDDRVVIREYISEHYHDHCPPGLAKKHNGCRPPGHVKHYVVGEYLPAWEPVPQPLLVQLQPVPYGYRYVMVDKDVYLISEASKEIIDAVTLLSAVGH